MDPNGMDERGYSHGTPGFNDPSFSKKRKYYDSNGPANLPNLRRNNPAAFFGAQHGIGGPSGPSASNLNHFRTPAQFQGSSNFAGPSDHYQLTPNPQIAGRQASYDFGRPSNQYQNTTNPQISGPSASNLNHSRTTAQFQGSSDFAAPPNQDQNNTSDQIARPHATTSASTWARPAPTLTAGPQREGGCVRDAEDLDPGSKGFASDGIAIEDEHPDGNSLAPVALAGGDLQAPGSPLNLASFQVARDDGVQKPGGLALVPSRRNRDEMPLGSLGLTALEFARRTFPSISADSDIAQSLGSRPALRAAEFRKQEDEKKFLISRQGNVEALLVQISGEEAARPCSYCYRGKGKWTQCVTVDGYIRGACANCHVNNDGTRCPWHSNTRNPESQELPAVPQQPAAMAPAMPAAQHDFPLQASFPDVQMLVDSSLTMLREMDEPELMQYKLRVAAKSFAAELYAIEQRYQAYKLFIPRAAEVPGDLGAAANSGAVPPPDGAPRSHLG